MEVCNGGDKAVATETTTNMYKRHDSPGHDMVAAHNGDFFHVSTTDATAVGMSRMGLVSQGEMLINPTSWGYPLMIMTQNKEMYADAVNWSATLTAGSSSTRIHTLNSHFLELDAADDAERMILYTDAYGTKTNEVFGGTKVIIAPKEGEFMFSPNSTNVCIVENIADNTGATEIPAGKAVLYGTGANATFLQGLTVGQECSISTTMSLVTYPSVDNVKEMVGGNTLLLRNGEAVQQGEVALHPRTFAGFDKDRTKMWVVAVDGRWGGSAGIILTDQANILKLLGAWDGINLDGGGSTTMVINGVQTNHPSDGNERAVGNAVLYYSTAPVDDNISKIVFEPRAYNVPITARFAPSVYGFNQYDVLKSQALEDVKFSCDENIGYFNEANEFIATDKIAEGYIYAEYNGIKTQQLVKTIMSPLTLVHDSYVVDDRRGYPILMTAQIGNFNYGADAASVEWTIDKPELCTLNDGKVQGVENGVATLSGVSANFNGNVTVNVEIPEAETKSIFPAFETTTWSCKQVGGNNATVVESGEGVKITYTGNGSSRGASLSAYPTGINTYGLPIAAKIVINPGDAIVKNVQLSFVNNLGEVYSPYASNTQLRQNADNELTVTFDNWKDDNVNYPISLSGIVMSMGKSNSATEYGIDIKKFEQIYAASAGIESVFGAGNAINVYPNPAQSGSPVMVGLEEGAVVEIYTLGGAMAKSEVVANGLISTAGLPAGMYILKSNASDAVAKLIVK